MSVKRSIRRERPEAVLFERSEFTDDSERRMRSSEAGVALIFCLLFHQGKSRFNYFYIWTFFNKVFQRINYHTVINGCNVLIINLLVCDGWKPQLSYHLSYPHFIQAYDTYLTKSSLFYLPKNHCKEEYSASHIALPCLIISQKQ